MHSGGMVNVVTISGTNKYHGSGFEFIRNNYLDATNFFSVSKDTLHQNQFGGTFGGPILRDKLFAFAGYQRTESKQSQAATQGIVPTAAILPAIGPSRIPHLPHPIPRAPTRRPALAQPHTLNYTIPLAALSFQATSMRALQRTTPSPPHC